MVRAAQQPRLFELAEGNKAGRGVEKMQYTCAKIAQFIGQVMVDRNALLEVLHLWSYSVTSMHATQDHRSKGVQP